MGGNLVNTRSIAGALGLLLALPGLASAEGYYVKTNGYR